MSKEMKEPVMKRKSEAGWIIDTNSGLIHCDKEGRWWLGGGTSVHIAIFKEKKEATDIRKKLHRDRPDLINRSWVSRASFVTKR